MRALFVQKGVAVRVIVTFVTGDLNTREIIEYSLS